MSTNSLQEEYLKDVGLMLNRARHAQGLEISEIAPKLALSPAQLRHLEEGRTDFFYNERFYLQAARRYSEFLKIHLPEPVLEFLPAVDEIKSDSKIKPEQDAGFSQEVHQNGALKRLARKRWVISLSALFVIALGVVSILEPKLPAASTPPALMNVQESQAQGTPDGSPQARAQTNLETNSEIQEKTKTGQESVEKPGDLARTSEIQSVILDSSLMNTTRTWVQIVGKDGKKTDLRPQAGELVEFDAKTTAAIAFGRPSTATLTVRGARVQVEKFLVEEASPPRALVIIRDL